jgi:LPS-assembly protein
MASSPSRCASALVLVILVVLAAPQRTPRAQQDDLGSGPVVLLADEVQYDNQAQVVTAQGNVEVTRGDRRLLADRLRYDQVSNEVRAEGNVTLLEPGGEAIFADSVVLSGDLRNGVAEQLRARLPDDSLFAASRGTLIDGNRTELDRAVYSPCPVCEKPGSEPLWQITAQKVVHDRDAQEVSYRHAFLEFGGVPVLYTPYFFHPDPSVERKSGFLAPSYGNDTELGFMIQTPYYFALAPNYDLTVAPIFMTQEKPVLVTEYRHLLKRGRFEIGGSGTYATAAGSDANPQPTNEDFRGHLEGEGRFNLPDRWKSGYDLLLATDNTYLLRYGFSNENVLNNRVYTERIRNRNFASIDGLYFQGLREQDHQGEIPVVAPRVRLQTSHPWRWGSRFDLDGSTLVASRWDGLDTRRLSAGGDWKLPWQGVHGNRARLSLGLRGDVYQTNGDPESFGSQGGNNVVGRLFPRVAADWSWPWIGDTFGLTPLLEPTVSATWIPNYVSDDDEQIPNEDSQDLQFDDTSLFEADRFPGLDRVQEGAWFNYGLRFAGYGSSGPLVSGLFGQAIRVDGSNDLPAGTGLDGRFSDYVGRIDFTPHRWLDARYRFGIDGSDLTFLRHEVGAEFGPRALRFDVDYLFLQDDPALQSDREREEITAGVRMRLTSSLTLRAQTRRNLAADRTIFHRFGLVYEHPCMQVVLGVKNSNVQDRDVVSSTTFTIRVVLRNLGELRTGSSSFGSLTGS